jgi:hypothetical protein
VYQQREDEATRRELLHICHSHHFEIDHYQEWDCTVVKIGCRLFHHAGGLFHQLIDFEHASRSMEVADGRS